MKIGKMNPGVDLQEGLDSLIADGCDTIFLEPHRIYAIPKPLIITGDKVEIHGVNSWIQRQYTNPKSSDPMIFAICNDLLLSNVAIDIARPPEWVSFIPAIVFEINQAQADRLRYDGPMDTYVARFEMSLCSIVDSNGRTKANSGQAGVKDHWGIVSKLPQYGGEMILRNNSLKVHDMELTGATDGWSSIVFDGNHIRGGSTTAPIDILSKFSHNPARTVQSLTVVNNVVYDVQRTMIAIGYDGNSLGNANFEQIRIEDNIGIISPECRDEVSMLIFKSREFAGTFTYRGNTMDLRNVDSDREGFKPIDARMTNYKWGDEGSHVTTGAGMGKLIYSPSEQKCPTNSRWAVVDAIRWDHFESA